MSWRLYPQRFEPPAQVSTAETVTVDKWYGGLSQPTRRAGIAVAVVVASGAVISPWALTQPETTTVDRWHSALSSPQRARIGLAAHEQQALAFVKAAPFAETVSADRWVQPTAQPTRALRRVQPDAIVAPSVETITTDKWFEALSEPVRIRRGLAANQQQSVAYIGASPFTETVSLDRWFRPLNEPSVKSRPSLAAGQRPYFAFAQPEDVTVAKWLTPLSEPQRSRPALRIGDQQYAALTEAAPFPETVSIDRWQQPLSEPRRFRAAVTVQQTTAFWPYPLPNIDAPVGVFVIYPDRVLGRKLPTNEQQSLAFVKAAPFAESVTADRWLQALSQPNRRAVVSVSVEFRAPTIPAFLEWYAPLAGPVRAVQRTQQQTAAFYSGVVTAAETITADKWLTPFSAPVRAALGLPAYLQVAFIIDPAVAAVPVPVGGDYRRIPDRYRDALAYYRRKLQIERHYEQLSELDELDEILRRLPKPLPATPSVSLPPVQAFDLYARLETLAQTELSDRRSVTEAISQLKLAALALAEQQRLEQLYEDEAIALLLLS